MSPRPYKFRFYIDENFPVPAGKFLKSLGHNVYFVVYDKIGRGKTDLWHLKQTIKEKRILLGLDRDFQHFKILANLVRKSSGIIFISSSDLKSEKIIPILKKLLNTLTENKICGKICIASVDKIKYIKPN